MTVVVVVALGVLLSLDKTLADLRKDSVAVTQEGIRCLCLGSPGGVWQERRRRPAIDHLERRGAERHMERSAAAAACRRPPRTAWCGAPYGTRCCSSTPSMEASPPKPPHLGATKVHGYDLVDDLWPSV